MEDDYIFLKEVKQNLKAIPFDDTLHPVTFNKSQYQGLI